VLQSAIRVYLSKCRVHHRRTRKLRNHAAGVLVQFFRGIVAVSQAKAIVQERREQRAALKIQSLQRGIMARERVQAIRSRRLLMQRSAVAIQCLYRAKVRAVYRVRERQEELELEKRRLFLLALEEQQRRELAVLRIQCFGRLINAKRRVREKRSERQAEQKRQEMATKIQKLARRVLETQSDKDRLAMRIREKEERERALQRQQTPSPVEEIPSRPSSSSSTSSLIHSAAVKLQSIYRGAVVRETVKTKREEKKKNAPKLFYRPTSSSSSTTSGPTPESPARQSSSRNFLGFRSKSTASPVATTETDTNPRPPTAPSPSTHTSFFQGLMRSSSRDHDHQHSQHSQLSARSEEEKPVVKEEPERASSAGPPPGSAIHRMLSIVKSVSRDEEDSPAPSPVKEPRPIPDRGDPLADSEQPSDSVLAPLDEEHHLEVDEEVQKINMPASDEPLSLLVDPPSLPADPLPSTSSTPTQQAAHSKSPASRHLSVLTPITAVGKKLFRTNSEVSPQQTSLAKSPSFFRSLSRPSSRPDSSSDDQKKGGLTAKSPSLLRSLSQSLFGDKTPALGRSQSRASQRATPLVEGSEEVAAAMIQRAARVRQAKRRTRERREMVVESQRRAGEWVMWAVTMIQRVVRGRLSRQRVKRIRKDRSVSCFHPSLSSPPHLAVSSSQEQKKKQEKDTKHKKRAEADAKLHKEDEEEVQNILKYQSYGKPSSASSPGKRTKEKESSKSDTEKEKPSSASSAEKPKKKKKKIKSTSRPTTATPPAVGADDESTSRATTARSEESTAMSEQMKRLEELERSMKEKEQRMVEATKHAEEKASAIERALELMEKRAKEEEFERAQRKKFLDMAAGSPYSSLGPFGSSRPPVSSRMNSSRAPPSARSARDGTPRPKDAMKLLVHGVEWVQLWDSVESAWYWYCEASGAAQWEQPTEYYDPAATTASGYESAGAMTDYSTDNYESGGETYQEEGGSSYGPWQEFWDESAQAKYWYNNETGEASWTVPDEYSVAETSSATAPVNEWVSYIDENTGQEYWYNPATGETSWG
jgi:hypothetical protein